MDKVYVKFLQLENGIVREKQTPAIVLKEDNDIVTVKMIINGVEETRVLNSQQYSKTLYTLDYL